MLYFIQNKLSHNFKAAVCIFGFRYILLELGCHCICILHLVQPADNPILYGKTKMNNSSTGNQDLH